MSTTTTSPVKHRWTLDKTMGEIMEALASGAPVIIPVAFTVHHQGGSETLGVQQMQITRVEFNLLDNKYTAYAGIEPNNAEFDCEDLSENPYTDDAYNIADYFFQDIRDNMFGQTSDGTADGGDPGGGSISV